MGLAPVQVNRRVATTVNITSMQNANIWYISFGFWPHSAIRNEIHLDMRAFGQEPRTIFGSGTTFIVPAGLFPRDAHVPFHWRFSYWNVSERWSRWHSSNNTVLIASSFPPFAPTNLRPTEQQNRMEPITLSWQHRPRTTPVASEDPQINSQVEYWQGTGERRTASGGLNNAATLPAVTFLNEIAVNFRARTQASFSENPSLTHWGAWSNEESFTLSAMAPPQAPTSLQPTTPQNRTRPIVLSWTHVATPGFHDPQDDSQVEYWQGTGTRTLLNVSFSNRVTLMEGVFDESEPSFSFRVRTHGQRGGWGPWSAAVTVSLIIDPPLAPTNLAPSNEVFHALQDISFSWRHTPNPNDWDSQSDSELEFWQGANPRQSIFGGIMNRAIAPGGTFMPWQPVHWRVRTQTLRNGWGEWSAAVSFNVRLDPAFAPTLLKPTNLTPENGRNPNGLITASWLHNVNPDARNDKQTNSEARFRQGAGAWRTVAGGIENTVILPIGFFTSRVNVEWQARTETRDNGWGEWSASVTFELRETPPLPPTLIFPVNIPVRAVDGAFLEWGYNSPYDTFPRRFDVRYRAEDDNDWTEIRMDAIGDLPATANSRTRSFDMQTRVEWQVRAWGEWGDMGPWSDTAVFFVIGVPPKPELVKVTNSNRPTVHFSARMAQAWEIEIIQNGEIIYHTGMLPFTGLFSHTLQHFIPNGNYLARFKISNEYGIQSEWAELAFNISISPPEAINLKTANNVEYHTKLWFNGENRIVYIYRAELDNDIFTRIARLENANEYDDWIVRPRTRYKYFVRVVNEYFAFADSKVETAICDYMDTTIADVNNPSEPVKLLGQLGGKPTKDSDFVKDNSLTHFAGREKPVLQVGEHTDRTTNLSFYVSLDVKDALEILVNKGNILILRDWRLGVIYGTIAGSIRVQSDGLDNCHISFSFTEADYNIEVPIE